MKHSIQVIITLILLLSSHLHAQSWEWARQTTGSMTLGTVRSITGLTTDVFNNCLVTGYYSDTTNIGGQTFYGRGSVYSDAFIAKYSTDGTALWAKRIYAASGVTIIQSRGIVSDANANVYVVGTSAGNATVESQTLSSGTFVLKYAADGRLVFAKNYGRLGAAAICLDSKNNICLLGAFNGGTISLGSTTLNGNGKDYCVAKLDADGNVMWAQVILGTLYAQTNLITDISCDAEDNIFICGNYSDSLEFDATHSVKNSEHIYDLFFAKYNASGAVQWARTAGAKGSQDQVRSMALDKSGNAYLVGVMAKNARFGDLTTDANANANAFITKVNGAGEFMWLKIVCEGQDCKGSVCVDAAGNPLFAGQFGGTLSFGDSVLNSLGSAFLAKFDTSGKALWGTCPTANLISTAGIICMDSKGAAFLSGSFAGTVSFGTHSVATGDNASPLKSQQYIAKLAGIGSTQTSTLGTPVLVYPPSGFETQNGSLELRWDNVVGAVRYQLQVSTDSEFTAPLFVDNATLTSTSYTVTGLQSGRAYYWRARAFTTQMMNAELHISSESQWSKVRNFTVRIVSNVQESTADKATVQFSPQPFADKLYVSISTSSTSSSDLEFYDLCGRLITVQKISIDHGGLHRVEIDSSPLPLGLIMYRVTNTIPMFVGQIIRVRE